MRWLLPLLLFAWPLAGHSKESLEVYLQPGFHVENLSIKLNSCAESSREFIRRAKWGQITAPEIRLGALWQIDRGWQFQAEGGCLLSRAASADFSTSYHQDFESSGLNLKTNQIKHLAGHDFNCSIGYDCRYSTHLSTTLLIGYSEQKRQIDGFAKPLSSERAEEPGKHLVQIDKAGYSVRWQGPWVGIRWDYAICPQGKLAIDAEYHHAFVKAKSKWQVKEFLSDDYLFSNQLRCMDKGAAPGLKLNAFMTYDLSDHWQIGLRGYYALLIMKHGKGPASNSQTVYSPQKAVISSGKYDQYLGYQVLWQAYAILGSLNYVF